MKKTFSQLEHPYRGLDDKSRKQGVSVFGINNVDGTFEPLFDADCRRQAQTILDKLCSRCEEDCQEWKRKLNACYRIVTHEKD